MNRFWIATKENIEKSGKKLNKCFSGKCLVSLGYALVVPIMEELTLITIY